MCDDASYVFNFLLAFAGITDCTVRNEAAKAAGGTTTGQGTRTSLLCNVYVTVMWQSASDVQLRECDSVIAQLKSQVFWLRSCHALFSWHLDV